MSLTTLANSALLAARFVSTGKGMMELTKDDGVVALDDQAREREQSNVDRVADCNDER